MTAHAAGGQAQRRTPKACPPSLIGGESSRRAKVDWCTWTFFPFSQDLHCGAECLEFLRTVTGVPLVGGDAPGLLGYDKGFKVFAVNGASFEPVARVDWGGAQHGGRARVDLSGKMCGLVDNWREIMIYIAHAAEAKLTRVDLAVDLEHGELGVEDCREWWQAGDFNSGGRRPSYSTVGAWIEGHNDAGRTLYVGKRQNGKMLRCYEKGRQLGQPDNPWVRFEVEIRNIDRDIPLDILTDCDTYFAGAYKCMERVLDAAPTKVPTHQKEGEIAVEHLVKHGTSAYGGLVHVLRATMSAGEIVSLLSRPVPPKRLAMASLKGFLPPRTLKPQWSD